jgi:hypothetical protein
MVPRKDSPKSRAPRSESLQGEAESEGETEKEGEIKLLRGA